MSRPRIRTLKPDVWQDERVGRLGRDERLLFVGLITFADDEGRFRALPAAILGHVYPYDHDITPRKVTAWLEALDASGLIVLYDHDGTSYGCLPKWSSHQRVNRGTPSTLPEPSLNGKAHAQ